MTNAVKKLFEEFEKAFNALEVEKQVPLFAEHFISAQFYRSVGQTSGKILSMDETAMKDLGLLGLVSSDLLG